MNISIHHRCLFQALGLALLAVRALADSSFSPDDAKILVPAFDPQSGDLGLSICDRQTRQLEPLFVPSRLRCPEGTERQAVLLRPQFLADGKRCFVAWPGYSDNDDDVLNGAVLPRNGPGPVRFFSMPGVEDAQSKLLVPPVVAGHYLLVPAASNLVVRFDLDTGETASRLLKGQTVSLLPSWHNDVAYYLAANASQARTFEVGRLDPESFAQTPLWQIPDAETKHEGAFAVSPDGKRFVVLQLGDDALLVKIWRGSQLEENLKLALKDEDLRIGNVQFAPDQNVLYAGYTAQKPGQPSAYGLLKISVADSSLKRIPLLQGGPQTAKDEEPSWQVALSHDGKTAALCSTCLLPEVPTLKPEDCALFLVDLADPQNAVKRVPLPVPKRPRPPAGNAP